MKIYIDKNNQQSGPFEEAQVLEMVGIGLYSPDDLAIRHGENQWQPLKVLLPHLFQTAPTNTVVSNNQQNFSNQAVVDWAKRNLQKGVEIELKHKSPASKIFLIFAYGFMGIVFLGVPLAFIFISAARYTSEGWSENVSRGVVCGGLLLLILGTLFLGIIWLPMMTRRKIAKMLSVDGLETRGGQKYVWKNLQFLNYRKVNTRVSGNLAASVVQSALFAGVEKVSVDLMFTNGTAVIPPLISNQKEILGLLETMPVKRKES